MRAIGVSIPPAVLTVIGSVCFRILFLVLQKAVLTKHADPHSRSQRVRRALRRRGFKIGSTTGYTRELMEVILPIAAAAGYAPEATVCSDEVAAGRPAPWSNLRAAELLGVYPMSQIMIVDDRLLKSLKLARMLVCTVAVTTTGNPLG